MEKKWEVVFKSTNRHQVIIFQQVLKNHDIESVIIDQVDSSYLNMLPGSVQLRVSAHDFSVAKQIIDISQEELEK